MTAPKVSGHAADGHAGSSLEDTLESALRRIQNLEDKNAIIELHYKYGYYLDKCLYEQVVDLFADNDKTAAHFHGGIWRGKEGVCRLYIGRFQTNFTNGRNGPIYGFLLDHCMYQPICDVAPDGLTAKMRLRCNMQAGLHVKALHDDPTHRDYRERQWFEGGLYENEYVKENGVWKFQIFRYRPTWHADWRSGIAYTPEEFVPIFKTLKSAGNPYGPDEAEETSLWPDTDVLPFHYPDAKGNMLTPEEIKCVKKTYTTGSNGRIA